MSGKKSFPGPRNNGMRYEYRTMKMMIGLILDGLLGD
jgi:hypothetical protein